MKKTTLTLGPKISFLMLAVLLPLFWGILSCDSGDLPNVEAKARMIEDNQGSFLGHLGYLGFDAMQLYTKTGYWVTIDWEGNLLSNFAGSPIYYADVDAGGTAFALGQFPPGSGVKMVYPNQILGKYYTNDELKDPAVNPITYSSIFFGPAEIENEEEPQNYSDNYYLLKEIQYEEIGFPSEIKLPLEIVFD